MVTGLPARSFVPMKPPNHEYLFVYGSLRRTAATREHRAMLAYGDYLEDGFMKAKLSWVNGYPVAHVLNLSKVDRIEGEVYELHDAGPLFAWLDDYEDCLPSSPYPRVYQRKQYPVNLASGRVLSAWVYVAA